MTNYQEKIKIQTYFFQVVNYQPMTLKELA